MVTHTHMWHTQCVHKWPPAYVATHQLAGEQRVIKLRCETLHLLCAASDIITCSYSMDKGWSNMCIVCCHHGNSSHLERQMGSAISILPVKMAAVAM